MTEAAEITLTEVLEKSQAFLENEIKIDFVKLTGTIELQFKLKGSIPDVSHLFFFFFSPFQAASTCPIQGKQANSLPTGVFLWSW